MYFLTEFPKINTDGAADSEHGKGGAGFVVRDHQGAFVSAGCSRYDGVSDPLTIKLLACRDVLAAAQNSGLQYVEVETDCQQIQNLWEAPQKSSCFHLIREMRDMCNFFQGFKLRYACRRTNSAAHRVARHALKLSVSMLVYDVIPGWLTDCLQSDMLAPNE